jgi:hypothetical protein
LFLRYSPNFSLKNCLKSAKILIITLTPEPTKGRRFRRPDSRWSRPETGQRSKWSGRPRSSRAGPFCSMTSPSEPSACLPFSSGAGRGGTVRNRKRDASWRTARSWPSTPGPTSSWSRTCLPEIQSEQGAWPRPTPPRNPELKFLRGSRSRQRPLRSLSASGLDARLQVSNIHIVIVRAVC